MAQCGTASVPLVTECCLTFRFAVHSQSITIQAGGAKQRRYALEGRAESSMPSGVADASGFL